MSAPPQVALGEVFEIARGGSPRPIDKFITDDPSGINWIMIGDATEGSKYIAKTRKRIRPEGAQRSRSVKPGDFLLTNSMSFGKPYIMRTHGCIHDGWLVMSPRSNQVDADFFYHLLGSRPIYAEFERRASGATVKNLNIDLVRGVTVPLPPLAEQRRIAAILDKADALRAKRREALAQLDRLTQSIFIEMFGDPSDKTPRFATHPLEELVEGGFQNGAYFPKESYAEDGVEMVHMSDAFGGVIKRGGLKRVRCSSSELEKYRLTEDDLIIARRSLTYDGAARPCMVPKSTEPLIFESSFIRVRSDKERVTTQFLFRYLNDNRVREKFVRPYVTQSTISGINQSNLSKVPLVVPPLTLQNEFSIRIEAIETNARKQCESAAELDSLFASLQHRAFRGEL